MKKQLGISDFRSHWSGYDFPRSYFSDPRPVEIEAWPKWLTRSKLPLGPSRPTTTPEPITDKKNLCGPVFISEKPPRGLASGLIAWSERPASGQSGFWYRPSWPQCDIIFDLANFFTEIN